MNSNMATRKEELKNSAVVLLIIDEAWPASQGYTDLLDAIELGKPLLVVQPPGLPIPPKEYYAYDGQKLLLRSFEELNGRAVIRQFFTDIGFSPGDTLELLDRPF